MAVPKETIKLMKQLADDLERWIDKEPDKPFPDFQFLSETIFYAGNKKAAVPQLSRIERILLPLRKHNQGWADALVKKVEDFKTALGSVDKLDASGYRRRQCVNALDTPALRLVQTLRDIAKMAEQPTETGPENKNTKREQGEINKWYQTNTFKGAVIALVVTLLGGGIPAWISLCNKTDHDTTANTNIFADVSKDGSILRSKNFPWDIKKTKNKDGNILYTIVDRRGDTTAVSVVPDKPKYTVYQSYGGMVIKYTCPEEKISSFTIKLKY